MKEKRNRLSKIFISPLLSLFFLLTKNNTVWAITNPVTGIWGQKESQEAAESGVLFITYFARMWSAGLSLGAILVLGFYLWGAIDWITAEGDSSKLSKARNKIVQATVGLIIMVGILAIVGFLGPLLFGTEFNLLQFTFPKAEKAEKTS